MSKKQFKAESKRLLDLMINSIYTHKEIFLREIISNASDAIDKLCYLSLTDENVGLSRGDFRIFIKADRDARTLTVSDNGVGMSREELEQNLGVIARSGSLKFKRDNEAAEESADLDIIGQFGVGFYSAFMVADKVTVISRAYGAEIGARWESSGADGYTVSDCEKDAVGTDVIMHLKADGEDEDYGKYLREWELKALIKKYSDYIRWPIVMDVEKGEMQETGETDEKGEPKKSWVTHTEEETVNSMVPIWQRPKSEASDEDCAAFYKEKFHDSDDPLCVIRVNAEGLTSYKAMLFVPKTVPYDFYTRDFKPGVQLYSTGVMIMENCADLLPDCFRFVRGVVDSPDLSLNISRELLQHDRQLKLIAKNLEKKIKEELRRLMDEKSEDYEKFFQGFGRQLKYGLVSDFGAKKETLQDLLLFRASGEEPLIPLREYVAKMPEGQKYIYYACGENTARAAALPQCEQVRDAGYELLYFTDDVDEFVAQAIGKYEEKEFRSVTSGDLGLESEEKKADMEKREEEAKPLLGFVKDSLEGAVESAKLSHRLKSAPVCLATEGEITLEMEKYFQNIPGVPEGQNVKAKRVLELNADHPAFAALEKTYAEDKERAAQLSKILLAQAELMAGLTLSDPGAYTELVCGLF